MAPLAWMHSAPIIIKLVITELTSRESGCQVEVMQNQWRFSSATRPVIGLNTLLVILAWQHGKGKSLGKSSHRIRSIHQKFQLVSIKELVVWITWAKIEKYAYCPIVVCPTSHVAVSPKNVCLLALDWVFNIYEPHLCTLLPGTKRWN